MRLAALILILSGFAAPAIHAQQAPGGYHAASQTTYGYYKDLTRLPYWAEVSLNQLPPGRYVLQVTANDRTTKSSASQTAGFVID